MPIYYASPTGNSNGLSQGSPFKISDFFSVAVAGDHLYLLNGTYTGSNSMITPPSGLSGSLGNPITISALIEGGVLVDGENARIPVLLTNNNWWILEGFNAKSADSFNNVIDVDINSSNNIIRRVCGWDAGNTHAVFNDSGSNNLFEDVAGFGQGRKIFANSQGSVNTNYRRAFGLWNYSTATNGPKEVFSNSYNSHGGTYENCIAAWNADSGTPAFNDVYGLFIFERMNDIYPDICADGKYLGCLGFILSTYTANINEGCLQGGNALDCIEFKDCAIAINNSCQTASLVNLGGIYGGPSSGNHKATNVTEIRAAGPAAFIDSDWTIANRKTGVDAASIYGSESLYNNNGSKGATIRYRYVNRVLTTTELWPWPMNQRIINAMTTAGRTPVNINSTIQSIFGTFPSTTAPPLLYVSPTGLDTNPGTISSPLKTLAFAFSTIAAGGTIYLRSGTYTETSPNWHTIKGGTSFSNATLISIYSGDAAGSVIIKPLTDTLTGKAAHFYSSTCKYIIVNGLTFDGTNLSSSIIKVNNETGTGSAHHIRIQNCTTQNTNFGYGVNFSSTGSNEVLNSTITASAFHGIYLDSPSNIIDGNYIHTNGSTLNEDCGILCNTSGAASNIIRNNTVTNNNFASGIRIRDGANNLVYNNVVYQNYEGIYAYTAANNTGIYNNTLYNNVVVGIGVKQSTSSIIRNNIVYVNGGGFPIQDDGLSTYTADHNMAGINPHFVNANGADFHLTSASIDAIDNGQNLSSIFTTDKDGNGRTDGFYDLGAYEFQGSFVDSPIDMTTLLSGAVVNKPTLRYIIALPTITTSVVVNTPTVTGLTLQTLTAPSRASTAAINVPSVAYRIALPLLTNTATLYPPVMGYIVRPPALTSGSVTAPTVQYLISLPTIATGAAFNAPTVFVDIPDVQPAFPPKLTNVAVLYAPTVTAGAVTLLPPTIATGAVVTAPEPAYGIISATLANTSLFFSLAVSLAGAQAIITPTVTNTNSLYDATVTTTAVVSLPTITSGATLYPPGLETLRPPTITSGSAVYAPSLQSTIQLPALAIETELGIPLIAGGQGSAGQPSSFITVYMWKRIR